MASYIEKPGMNEVSRVHEVRGTIASDPRGALQEMAAIASASRCTNFLYHASINPEAREHLTPEQWRKAVDTLEKNLGLEGHQRILFEHFKGGRQHFHIVWNRVDAETIRAVRMSNNYLVHERTARELEREFGLKRVQGVHAEREKGSPRPSRTPQQWEIERGKKSGLDPRAIKAEITELWNENSTGREFAAAIEDRGYVLLKGDRRDFCILDQAGDIHSLARRIDGAKAADVREKMKDIDRERLPDVETIRSLSWRQEWADLKAEKLAEKQDALSLKEDTRSLPEPKTLEARDDTHGERIMVAGLAGVAEKLTRFVEGITDFFVQPPKITYEDFLKSSAARKAYFEQEAQEQKREQALSNISKDMRAGKYLAASDIQNLNRDDIQQIKLNGDDGIKALIQAFEREQQRQREGRRRER